MDKPRKMDDKACPFCDGTGRLPYMGGRGRYKTAKVIKEYTTTTFRDRYTVTVPVGAIVSNKTAMGPDDSYRFWADFADRKKFNQSVEFRCLMHDLEYYGLDVPAEYCEPYDD